VKIISGKSKNVTTLLRFLALFLPSGLVFDWFLDKSAPTPEQGDAFVMF